MTDNKLVGKTVTGVTLEDGGGSITFHTTEGDITARCFGECCSHTWIEAIEWPARGWPAEVLAVEDLNMPDLGDMPNCDVVCYYGCKVETSNGTMVIDYRNDSNGYYGGSLDFPSN